MNPFTTGTAAKKKMGCILDVVEGMLVRCPLSKNHTLAWQPLWGGGGIRVPWCRHVDVTTSRSPWVRCNSTKRASLTSLYAELSWSAIRYSNEEQGKWKDGSETPAHQQGVAYSGTGRYLHGQVGRQYPAKEALRLG